MREYSSIGCVNRQRGKGGTEYEGHGNRHLDYDCVEYVMFTELPSSDALTAPEHDGLVMDESDVTYVWDHGILETVLG